MHEPFQQVRILGSVAAVMFLGTAVFAMLSIVTTMAEEKKKRRGPPPKESTELPNTCARCHKADGRGGPAYGGFAADLRRCSFAKASSCDYGGHPRPWHAWI